MSHKTLHPTFVCRLTYNQADKDANNKEEEEEEYETAPVADRAGGSGRRR